MLRFWSTLLCALMVLAPLSPAQAAAQDRVTIETTSGSGNWWETITTRINWCPEDPQKGATLSVLLPQELTGFSRTFTVRRGNDQVGDAVVKDHRLEVTLTQALPAKTCAVLELESEFGSPDGVAGKDVRLTYVAAGRSIANNLKILDWDGNERDAPNVWVRFTEPDDQCRTAGRQCLHWYFDTQVGPLGAVQITSDMDKGQEIDCGTLRVRTATLNAHGTVVGTTALGGTRECTPTSLTVDAPGAPAGAMVRVDFLATATKPIAAGGVRFRAGFKTAGAVESEASERIRSHTARGHVDSSDRREAEAKDEPIIRNPWPLVLGGIVLTAIAISVARGRGDNAS